MISKENGGHLGNLVQAAWFISVIDFVFMFPSETNQVNPSLKEIGTKLKKHFRSAKLHVA